MVPALLSYLYMCPIYYSKIKLKFPTATSRITEGFGEWGGYGRRFYFKGSLPRIALSV